MDMFDSILFAVCLARLELSCLADEGNSVLNGDGVV